MPQETPGFVVTEDAFQAANHAASGIRETISIPSTRSAQRVAIRAKPGAETLKTLAAVHRRRHSGGRPAERDGAVHLNPAALGSDFHFDTTGRLINLQHTDITAAAAQAATLQLQVPIRIGASTTSVDPEALMTGVILGQFIAETTEGRTRIAKTVVAQVRSTNTRDGMDGLLLSSLMHLEHTADPTYPEALTVWRDSMDTAGRHEHGVSGVVVDTGSGTLGSVGAVLADPFHNGLSRPSTLDDLSELRGGDVMIGTTAYVAVRIIMEAILGAVEGYSKGGVEGAIKGGFEGAGYGLFDVLGEIGGVLGEIGSVIAGWMTAVNKENKSDAERAQDGLEQPDPGTSPIDSGDPIGPDEPNDPVDNDPDEQPGQPDESNDGTGPDPAGPDPDPDPDPDDVPPPDNGYPAPDDGGGDPWSLIGYGPMLSVRDAGTMVSATAGTIDLAQIPGLDSFRGGFTSTQPALTQTLRLADANIRFDATQMASLNEATRQIQEFTAAVNVRTGSRF